MLVLWSIQICNNNTPSPPKKTMFLSERLFRGQTPKHFLTQVSPLVRENALSSKYCMCTKMTKHVIN